jgi:hypothetical protein
LEAKHLAFEIALGGEELDLVVRQEEFRQAVAA